MRAEEKAKELVDKYVEYVEAYSSQGQIENAKQCALIAVDEIINSNPCDEGTDRGGNFQWASNEYFWQEVKREIEKL